MSKSSEPQCEAFAARLEAWNDVYCDLPRNHEGTEHVGLDSGGVRITWPKFEGRARSRGKDELG